MKKMYKENGLLSEHGELATHPVKMALWKVLYNDADIKQMDESELRVLGGAIQKIVGDLISERIHFKNEINKQLAAMKDEEFYAHLKEKYGDHWMLVSLTPEEFARLPRLSKEEIEAALQEGLKAREEAEKATPVPYINPGLRFK